MECAKPILEYVFVISIGDKHKIIFNGFVGQSILLNIEGEHTYTIWILFLLLLALLIHICRGMSLFSASANISLAFISCSEALFYATFDKTETIYYFFKLLLIWANVSNLCLFEFYELVYGDIELPYFFDWIIILGIKGNFYKDNGWVVEPIFKKFILNCECFLILRLSAKNKENMIPLSCCQFIRGGVNISNFVVRLARW